MKHKYVDRLYWPRCGFVFHNRGEQGTRRRCERAWGHWLFEHVCHHEGPIVKHESNS
jgi:hypothetical protein